MTANGVAEKNAKKNEDTINQEQVADMQVQLDAVYEMLAVIEFEPDGTIITANENFLATVGYTLAEIQGQHHRLFVLEDEARSPNYAAFWQQLAAGHSQFGEYQRVKRDGSDVWIQARYSALKDDDGNVYKVVKYASDITESVRLREEAVQQKAVIENAPTNIMVANTDGIVTYANPASLRTLKSIESVLPIRVDEIVGSSFDVFHKDPSHQRKLLSDPKNLPHEAEFEIAGEWLSLVAAAIVDADGNYAGPMIAWELVTEQKAG